jgi:TIR domain
VRPSCSARQVSSKRGRAIIPIDIEGTLAEAPWGVRKEYALKLRDQLKQLDFSCFLDADELPAGNSLNSTLKRALRKSATLVVVGTERAMRSRYVELEVGELLIDAR